MAQVVDTNFSLPAEYQQMLNHFCKLMSPEDVQLYYQIVLNARKDLPYADDEQAAFDMMLLRLLAFKPVTNKQELVNSTHDDVGEAHEDIQQLNDIEFPQNSTESVINKQVSETSVVENIPAENVLSESTEPSASHNPESTQQNTSGDEVQLNEQNTEKPLPENGITIGDTNAEQALADGQLSEDVTALNNELLAIEQQASALSQEPSLTSHQAENAIETVEKTTDKSIANASIDLKSNKDEANSSPDKTIIPSQASTESLVEEQASAFSSPVASAIATRNMLRSRKKSLEDEGKKSSDANMRQPVDAGHKHTDTTDVKVSKAENKKVNVPDISTLPEQPYNEEIIDPATIKKANQVDKWAHMIDSMSLIARLRQLAIHATIDEKSTDDLLILQLDQTIKHLNSDAAHKQLEQHISEYLQRKVTVELNIVEKTVADPYQIQSDINSKRYEYATQLLAEDTIVVALQEQFQAELDQETIVAR